MPSSDQVLGLAAGLKHESAPFDAKGLQSGSRPFPESLAEGAYLLACWRLAARSVCFNVANQVSAEPSKRRLDQVHWLPLPLAPAKEAHESKP